MKLETPMWPEIEGFVGIFNKLLYALLENVYNIGIRTKIFVWYGCRTKGNRARFFPVTVRNRHGNVQY